MKHISTIILTTLYLLLATGAAQSQSWQWGERGGSSDGSLGGGADEYAKDIATDANGNVYVLAHSVGKTSLDIAGVPVSKNWGAFDIMLVSFTCSGQLRWHKVIGCRREDYGYALKVDNNGGVYIAFKSAMYSGTGTNDLHFDTDTTVYVANTGGMLKPYKDIFLAKYDTSGNFQWVITPQPDTVTNAHNAAILSLDIDNQGVVHCLSILSPGLYSGAYTVSQQGTYILKYDANGSFQGGVTPNIDITLSSTGYAHFTRDNQLNRYYITGEVAPFGPVYIGGQQVKGAKYIAAFNNNGSLIWKREDTSSFGGITGRPVIDNSGNIYVAAGTRVGNEFNGYVTVSNDPKHNRVMLMKMDKDGKMIWATNSQEVSAAIFSRGITIRNSGEVVLTGSNVGDTKWETFGHKDSISTAAAVYHPFLARFNTQTGKLLGMEQLAATGNTSQYDIVADGRNNIYIGGEIKGSLTVNGKMLSYVGGTKDFFVAKYGHNNCNCTNIPEPEFTFTKNSHFDYSFTYTGTPGTMEWDLGDGTTSTQTNVNHVYTSPSEFVACVKVTNTCGDNIYCAKIDARWPDNVSHINANDNIKIYPNPANDVLTIEGQQAGTQIELCDIVGRNVYRGISKTEKETINISHLPQGNYIIQLTRTDGQRMTGKVVKR
jgi:hypothetical protein